MRRLAIGNFQESGAALPHGWVRVMIAVRQQILALLLGQFKGLLLGHGLLHSVRVLMSPISYYRKTSGKAPVIHPRDEPPCLLGAATDRGTRPTPP
jgi:hypothetical protein